MHPELERLGWSAFFEQARIEQQDSAVARITEEFKSHFRVRTIAGDQLATIAGKLRHQTANPGALPAVGDWVEVTQQPAEARARIERILPRRTRLVRKVAGRAVHEQVLATNLDTVFVVSGLNHDWNLRRIERYLAMVWDSGARPVLVLNKADLCPNPQEYLCEMEGIAPGVAVLLLSAAAGIGVDDLAQQIRPGQTAAFIGSSGVGKSTIINRLLGDGSLRTHPARESDDRGRHTTTSRQMHFLPAGGIVIDTPGMRELQLWENAQGVQRAFEDISALAQGCRFRDCTHAGEPGCAVQSAIANGELDSERLESRQKLEAELRFLERKVDLAAASREKDKWKKIHKAMRQRKPPY